MASDDHSEPDLESPAPPSPPRPVATSPLSAPTRLEMAREIEALRLAVREREGWLDELRREVEERDASYGWKDQEARTAVAEAAAARRETAQYQEDRDHVRRQLHAKTEECTAHEARTTKLEAEVADLRVERRRRLEEMVELREKLDTQADPPNEAPADRAEIASLRGELEDTQKQLVQIRETMTGLADELAASQDDAQVQTTAANASRAHNIELLQRVAAQGEELAALRAEIDQLHLVLSEERRTADARIATLNDELDTARLAADKTVELEELAAAHDELAALRGPTTAAPQPDLAARDARLAALERELADRVAEVGRLTQELRELRDRGFARYLESP